MNQSKLRVVFILGTLLVAMMLVAGFSVSAATKAPNYKEYRSGSAVTIDGVTYLLATNNTSVEILKFNQASALERVSELRLPQKIKDVVTTNEGSEAYAYVTTGRYLYRIRITNPQAMEIVLKRDAYQYSRGKVHTGSIETLATNGKNLFTAGQYGVRSMGLTNLLVEKYYFYDRAYGVAVNNQIVYVIGENKAYGFNLNGGKQVSVVDIKNADKQVRHPAVNSFGSGFAISDNAIIKMSGSKTNTYNNPSQSVNYSYAAVATDKAVYYTNGFGLTKFDVNLKKVSFLKTSITSRFGDRSWAVGVLSVNVNGGEKVIVFNKSSILVLANNLSQISQYKSSDNIQYNPQVTVSFDHLYFMTNQTITARLAGFWPNEVVKLTFGNRVYQAKTNNLGEAMISFNTPNIFGRYVLDITATNSATNHQETREVK